MRGGHVDKTYDDAKKHLDAIVIGPGEKSFVKIIYDHLNNNLSEVYASKYSEVPFSETLIPNRDFLPKEQIVNNKLFTGYSDVPATLTYFSRDVSISVRIALIMFQMHYKLELQSK